MPIKKASTISHVIGTLQLRGVCVCGGGGLNPGPTTQESKAIPLCHYLGNNIKVSVVYCGFGLLFRFCYQTPLVV